MMEGKEGNKIIEMIRISNYKFFKEKVLEDDRWEADEVKKKALMDEMYQLYLTCEDTVVQFDHYKILELILKV